MKSSEAPKRNTRRKDGQPKQYGKKTNGKKATGRPEKYTLEWCIEELEWMWNYLQADPKANTILFISELCLLRDYSPESWSVWRKMHGTDEKFSQSQKKIESFLENRLVKAGLAGKANPTMSIFTLKNKYGWKDKVDVTTNDQSITGIQVDIITGSNENKNKGD